MFQAAAFVLLSLLPTPQPVPGIVDRYREGYGLLGKTRGIFPISLGEGPAWLRRGSFGKILRIRNQHDVTLLSGARLIDQFSLPGYVELAGWSDTGPYLTTENAIYHGDRCMALTNPLLDPPIAVWESNGFVYAIERWKKAYDQHSFRMVTWTDGARKSTPWRHGEVLEASRFSNGYLAVMGGSISQRNWETLCKLGPYGSVTPLLQHDYSEFYVEQMFLPGRFLVSENRRHRRSKFADKTDVWFFSARQNPELLLTVQGHFHAMALIGGDVYGVRFQGWEMGAYDLIMVNVKTRKETQLEHAVSEYFPIYEGM